MIDRRTFFGVIAAPLVAKALPVPIAPPIGFLTIGGVKTPIASVGSISGPSINYDDQFWRKKIPTLLDEGSISFDITFEPNG